MIIYTFYERHCAVFVGVTGAFTFFQQCIVLVAPGMKQQQSVVGSFLE